MNRFSSSLLALSLLTSSLLGASAARADVPPSCNSFDQNVACDAASEGHACTGGGLCGKIDCGGDGPSDPAKTLYKCVTGCQAVIADTGMVCTGGGTWGKPCGDGGTCDRIPGYCPNSAYAACTKGTVTGAAGAANTGSSGAAGTGTAGSGTAGAAQAGATAAGSAGTTASGGDDDGGCSMSSSRKEGALAGLMLLVGAAALFTDRRRRA